MQVKKFAKWGLALTSTLVLGGAIAPVGNQLLGGSAVVYAQDSAVFEPYVVEFYIDGEYWGVANRGYNSGWPYVRLEPYSEEFPGKEWPSEELGGFTSNLPNVSVVTKEDLDSIGSVVKVYWTRKPVETLPAEQPTEQPAETPAEQPAEQPISVAVIAISESDGQLSHHYITINPGETKTVETPKVDGYKLDQYTSPTYELTYDNALKQLNSAGFAWVQFWMIKDAAPETPVEQPAEVPVEQPVETPAEQPTEQPVDQPADQPVEKPADQPAEVPTEQPAEQPAEQPVDQPADQPTEQPTEQPVSVAVIAISESDGPLSHYYVTINPGETKTVETPKVDGYKLDQYTSPTYELTYDNALKQLNSAGFAWVQFWMIKDAAPETPAEQPTEQPAEQLAEQPVETPAEQPTEQPTEKPVETPIEKPVETPAEKPAETKPVEQPVEVPVEKPAEQLGETSAEQPVETPAEQPVEQPVDTPTDKPVEQLTDASSLTDQTAGKVQAVTPTDKKTVDKSALSTPAVKPEEVSQPVAKTLPKTGDSSSMLLVLGGVLSGLSGLGLAVTSRKRD
ncbi:LPXTG cell wall anchor domain-containing protein [Streptococcus suis]|uniref:LPXTG cell wall anchor domain-containing protein n=1 Tax=Streptococcus suis TaxID=1307 RepID=UPI0024125527|nr:PT domain-containing protein [Streptococcus suis]MDG4528309.1 PT domain-containing protein [Streptococcus suis]